MHILVHGNNHHVLPNNKQICIVKLKQYEELKFEIEQFSPNFEQAIILTFIPSLRNINSPEVFIFHFILSLSLFTFILIFTYFLR